METVLVVGASGNIGVSVIIAARRTGRNVIAIVRNKDSENKVIQHVGSSDGIIFAVADIASDQGVQSVVDRVKAGELPHFQHVYSAVGLLNRTSPIHTLSLEAFRTVMKINLEANFLAYRATIPYLVEQANPNATWTLVTGAAGDYGFAGATAVSQGALYSLANVACLENRNTNIRFNEVYLAFRVDYDSVVAAKGINTGLTSSQFSRVYQGILESKEIALCRVSVLGPQDLDRLKYKKKLP